MYGIWGLYIGAARASGLLEAENVRLAESSPAGQSIRDFVERQHPQFLKPKSPQLDRFLQGLITKDELVIDLERDLTGVVDLIAGALRDSVTQREREFYEFHLLQGGPSDATRGLQPILASLIATSSRDASFVWSPDAMLTMARSAERHGERGQVLANRLRAIVTCESLLAPMSALWSYVLTLEGRKVAEVAAILTEQWGRKGLKVRSDEFSASINGTTALPAELKSSWCALAEFCAAGDYDNVVHGLLKQNALVMAGRGGAPWAELDRGRLRVKLREEAGELPTRAELSTLWRFPYFLESMRAVAAGLAEVK